MKRKLTKKQTAVAIAKDVIAQINAKKFIAEQGVYLGGAIRDKTPSFLKAKNEDKELQDILLKQNPKCRVCALGSVFLSKIRLQDDFKLRALHINRQFISDADMRRNLAKFFSAEELCEIEEAFEGVCEYDYPSLYEMQWKIKVSDLLIFIMKQIIAQKGHFSLAKAEKAAKNAQK